MLTERVIAVMDSLQQLAKGLNHPNPVRGLVPGALQLVVKLRVLVRGKIKTRRVLHHADADVASKAVHKNAVAVIAKTRHDAADEGQTKFQRDEPPKASGDMGMVLDDRNDGINDPS